MNPVLLDVQSEWASALVEAFSAGGVRDVVVSPGSRSTPFVLALLRAGSFRIHDVIDERSAAFFALGQARLSGRPSLLLCTSGTAGAHWYPALIEASEAGIPLLALTADRPLSLQGCRAPQTIDQTRLFGEHVRGFFELGDATGGAGSASAARRMIAQAITQSLGPSPGPVHLNVRGRKPLEPFETPESAESAAVRRAAGRPLVQSWAPVLAPAPDAIESLARAIARARRGLIVAGPASVASSRSRDAVQALAETLGFPLCAEPSSQLRFGRAPDDPIAIDAFDLLLESERFRAEPVDFVLQLGEAPTSGQWERWLSQQPGLERWVLSPWGWSDPSSSAQAIVFGDPHITLQALHQRLTGVPREPCSEWMQRLQRVRTAAWEAERAVVNEEPGLSEAEAARVVVSHVPSGGVFIVGNSLPIRLVNRHCPAPLASCDVLSQRGANGIDGFVAGAAGAASLGRPTVLLLGDVSLAHDLSSLAVASRCQDTPLVLVVLNNGGGRIFEQLPVARVADERALTHFTTPHATDFSAAAATYGVPFERVDSSGALHDALAAALERSGATLIEVVVPAHGDAGLSKRLASAVNEAVVRVWGHAS